MRRLTLEGVAPVDAARAAVEAGEAELEVATRTAPALPTVQVEGDPDSAGAEFAETFLGTVEAPTAPGDEQTDTVDEAGEAVPAGPTSGGEQTEEPRGRARLRALPGGATGGDAPAAAGPRAASAPAPTSGRVSALVDAALAYSRTACDNLLVLGPEGDPATWWTDLVEPAWLRLSERTVLAGPGEMPEVVLATAALRALRHYTEEFERAMVEAGGPPANHPSRMRKIVLVFAAPDEVVPLSAHALAAALAAQGSMARIVTGPASTHRSVELVTMVRPTAVVLATTQTKPDLDVVHAVNESYPELPIFVGLRADAAATDLPFGPTVQRVRSFTGLLHEVLAVIKAR
ncbi:hypothetical protein APR04_001525 [Promicromonospora umidemergens]|uniref:B12 binding protein n=2 Tax=Promicromonospora umidemergens TaxID=629679 RepID=A0ABP8Y8P3_9MICO|nr:hypothetical protein [Promicromonospora umidemergens]